MPKLCLLRRHPSLSYTKLPKARGSLLGGGVHAGPTWPLTSISCTCSSLVEYICCRDSSSSLFLSSRVFPSSAAKCKSSGGGAEGGSNDEQLNELRGLP